VNSKVQTVAATFDASRRPRRAHDFRSAVQAQCTGRRQLFHRILHTPSIDMLIGVFQCGNSVTTIFHRLTIGPSSFIDILTKFLSSLLLLLSYLSNTVHISALGVSRSRGPDIVVCQGCIEIELRCYASCRLRLSNLLSTYCGYPRRSHLSSVRCTKACDQRALLFDLLLRRLHSFPMYEKTSNVGSGAYPADRWPWSCWPRCT
jgi:hypothetical protein